MSEVFVSYKRENEERVGPLVSALENAGFGVWWDRGLAGGESWREQIQAALDAAKCVVVVWTRESVGPDLDFVRDEAGEAKRRNILVPVLLDPVTPPLGFVELQAVDLTRWQGKSKDIFFQDLCSAVAAKIEGRPVPRSKGPMKRLMRRIALGGASAFALGAAGVSFNIFSAQDQICGLNFAQPMLSDACGAIGFGHRPTRAERLAWEGRTQGSCEALRSHIEQFPDGVLRGEAADILQAKRVSQRETWVASKRRLVLVGNHDEMLFPAEGAAKSAALSKSQVKAERQCKSFAASLAFQFLSARIEPQDWDCQALDGGVACDFEGEVVCELNERRLVETETCPG